MLARWLVLVVGGFFLNRAQRQNELGIAAAERETERQIAKEREEERLLENYFDTMKELLLEKNGILRVPCFLLLGNIIIRL